ncbi:amidophosphoribosyltransferase [Candidatus Bathyarchaeota archaeon]|nr:MAG: amidophosphoribosyltransferase [Candidatus Bathyarchaeota archaeon]
MVAEGCGVYGAFDRSGQDIFPYLYWGLLAQNHRGHQSHGFLTYKGGFHSHRALGLIPPIDERGIRFWLTLLPGPVGIGNVRYSTSGASDTPSLIRNTQPLTEELEGTSLSISFNGNVVNVLELRREFRRELEGRERFSDAVLLCRKMLKGLREGGDLASAAKYCMEGVEGAFSVAGLTGDGALFAFRDPHGIKPLCLGRDDNVTAISSESVGLNINGIDLGSEVKPGELVVVTREGVEREQVAPCGRKAFCAFEFAYFARPDSIFNSKYVYLARNDFGANLGRRYSDIARRLDVILSIPETADDAAYGFHEETGVPWDRALRRHRYVTQRAFITRAEERERILERKVNILKSRVAGKRVGVIDDSIVRGDTTRTNVKKLRAAGAVEVHLFITFPRIIGPCFYGIDMATYEELIGARLTPEEIAEELGADSVNYQPIEDFVRATGMRREDLCLGCVTGEYPTPLAQKMADEMRERFLRGEEEKGRIYEVLR